MTLSGRGRQQKGRAFELWVLKDLWKLFGREWPWKHQRPDDGHSLPPEMFYWHLEMKRQEKLNIQSAMWQARDEAERTGKMFYGVVLKRNREEPMVVVPYKVFKQLVQPAGVDTS